MTANEATLRQIEAADPTANTWLSANAGSGKTRVLTDRVARLLLAGVSPQNVLCLTYTKAAASEMQNRLFARLGAWAMKPDRALRDELRELGVDDIADLPRARRLFAAAIETPGGLKIQTIHSFCASILRRFPLEAGVTPQFQEMDDRSARLLQAEILDSMAAGADRPALEALAAFFTDSDFTGLTAEIVRRRGAFAQDLDDAEIWGWFDLPPGFDETGLPGIAFDGTERALIGQVGPILAAQSPTMQSLADTLAGLAFDAPGPPDLATLHDAFLYKSGGKYRAEAKTKSVPTKKAAEALGSLLDPFHAFMERAAGAREAEQALDAARKTRALHRFARPFVTEYERRKQARGWLDFDDLILRAGALLNDPGLAAWVLYRLDGGIDHILVDEAQDTSPDQWRVIESLARDFTAGKSARDEPRTLFVVGDMKQSIYSFQGADPSEFRRMRTAFGGAFERVGQQLRGLELEFSFRSSLAILDLVDISLKNRPGLGDEVSHAAFDIDKPGRVDLWPVVENPQAEPVGHWTDPVDMPAPEDASVVLANAVADAIADMIKTGTIPSKDGGLRPVTAGDIIVLVRRRSELFHQIIRACKQRDLPIAGADRLRIGGELAVKDLTALLAFLATPEDDLSLAAALRSPLFGVSEDALYRLAHGRDRAYLWNVLRKSTAHPETRAILEDLRGVADYLRPYELVDRILTRHDGRRRLVARLGPEAEDGIDALLAQALAYERIDVPSLTGFLTWLAAEEVEIKRQMDSASDRIRVMTVHGAKGLEAPVVVLPDTARRRPNDRDRLVDLGRGMAWRGNRDGAPAALRAASEARSDRDREEDMRLMYVALTRAESWLVIAAAGDVGGDGESWYRIAEAGMRVAGAAAQDFDLGPGLRYETGNWRGTVQDGLLPTPGPTPPLPGWTAAIPPPPGKTPGPLVPSDLGGAKIVAGEDAADPEAREAALRHGRQIHRLLEFLPVYPQESWPEVARALLGEGDDAVAPEAADRLCAEAAAVLAAPALAHLFAPDTLAEVEISAPVDIAGFERMHGVIDRLVIGPTHVLAVDFKTNRAVPPTPEAVPEGILRQMGAYEIALGQVFPGRRIDTAILWTGAARLMALPPGLALRAYGRLDAGQAGS